MDDGRFEDLAIRYVMGDLDEAEARAFEAEVRRRGEAGATTLREVRETLGAYALSATPAEPPPELRERILASVEGEERQEEAGMTPLRPRRRWAWIVAVGAAAALAVWLGVRNAELREERSRLRAELETARERLATADSARRELAELRDDLRLLATPTTSVRSLSGTDSLPDARARVFYDPATGNAILFAYDLPILPPDKVYELWAIEGETPRPAGVFRSREDGLARLEVEDPRLLEGVDALAVTVEPAPGVSEPTGEMVLISGS